MSKELTMLAGERERENLEWRHIENRERERESKKWKHKSQILSTYKTSPFNPKW